MVFVRRMEQQFNNFFIWKRLRESLGAKFAEASAIQCGQTKDGSRSSSLCLVCPLQNHLDGSPSIEIDLKARCRCVSVWFWVVVWVAPSPFGIWLKRMDPFQFFWGLYGLREAEWTSFKHIQQHLCIFFTQVPLLVFVFIPPMCILSSSSPFHLVGARVPLKCRLSLSSASIINHRQLPPQRRPSLINPPSCPSLLPFLVPLCFSLPCTGPFAPFGGMVPTQIQRVYFLLGPIQLI